MLFKKIRKENKREKEMKSSKHLTQVRRRAAITEGKVPGEIWPTVLDSIIQEGEEAVVVDERS